MVSAAVTGLIVWAALPEPVAVYAITARDLPSGAAATGMVQVELPAHGAVNGALISVASIDKVHELHPDNATSQIVGLVTSKSPFLLTDFGPAATSVERAVAVIGHPKVTAENKALVDLIDMDCESQR